MVDDLEVRRKQLKVINIATELINIAKQTNTKSDVKQLDDKLYELQKRVRIFKDSLE